MKLDTVTFIHELPMSTTEPAKVRGPRGEVGKGTPGSRLKAHRPNGMPLRKFARTIAAGQSYLKADAKAWMTGKGMR